MLKKWEYWLLTLPALAVVVLVSVNIALVNANRATQAEVTARAQYIQQSVQLEPLYREMIKALADLSVRNDDWELRDVLAKQGIKVSASPPAAREHRKEGQ